MNDRSTSPQEERFQNELQAEYDRYVDELRAVLDLDAGLADVFMRAESAEYVERLADGVLDVEAGLAAALAAVEDPDADLDADANLDTDQDRDEEEDPSSRSPGVVTVALAEVLSGNPLAKTQHVPDPDEDDSATIFTRLAQLRDSFLADRQVQRTFTRKSLHAATGHLSSLEIDLRLRRLSKAQAHETLARVEAALVEKEPSVAPAMGLSLIFSVACMAVGLLITILLGNFWRGDISGWIGLAATILFFGVGMISYLSMSHLRGRDRDKRAQAVRARLRRLHGDVDWLFDSSDDYSGVVSNP